MTSRYVKMVDGIEVPMTSAEISARQAEENAPAPPPTADQIIAATAAIITAGQAAMTGAPLPSDIREQVYDLEVFVANYIRRKDYTLARSKISAFVIDPNRTDVTQTQRFLVDNLKSQLLAIIPQQ